MDIASEAEVLRVLMEKAEAQLGIAREAKMTIVHNYELGEAEAQSDTARVAEATNVHHCGVVRKSSRKQRRRRAAAATAGHL